MHLSQSPMGWMVNPRGLGEVGITVLGYRMGKLKWRVLSQTEELKVRLGTHSHFWWRILCFHHCGSGSLSLFVNRSNAYSVPGTVFGAGNAMVLALGMTRRRCSGISSLSFECLLLPFPGPPENAELVVASLSLAGDWKECTHLAGTTSGACDQTRVMQSAFCFPQRGSDFLW